jgi:hypothetical protein
MRWTLTCRSADQNNGIRRVHLIEDEYQDRTSQSEEFLINTKKLEFREGDIWEANLNLISRRLNGEQNRR